MLTVSAAEARVADLVSSARKAGADAADALYVGDAATQVQVRLGALEDVSRSEGEEIGLRVFVGQRSATVSSSDLSSLALAALVERAVAMAREAPEDRWAGLAPEERLARGTLPSLDVDDGGEVAPSDLRARAERAEEAARSIAGVTNSEGAGASAGRATMALATSTGFCRGYATSSHGLYASVIAGEGSAMQRDHASHAARHFGDLDGAEEIGRRAGERAVARVDPGRLGSGRMPIVFDPRVGASLVGHLIGAISGSSIARRTSFLLDDEGKQVFARGITIRDDPHRPRGLRSKPFDGEGLPTAPRDLVTEGVLTGWLMETASARQLGREPTGHAARGTGGAPGVSATNVALLHGMLSPTALMADIADGLYVTELIGQGVNPVTGDYSRGASGFRIVGGEIAGPVAEITIAGNLKEMYAQMTAADDLVIRRGIDVPTLRIEGMTVAGA